MITLKTSKQSLYNSRGIPVLIMLDFDDALSVTAAQPEA